MISYEVEEVLVQDLKTKEIYHYIDHENGFNLKCREVFKDGQKIVHYPFSRKNGIPKYENVKSITYHKIKEPLPRGFQKTWANGFGFTRQLSPLIYFIQNEFPLISEIIISSELPTKMDDTRITFNCVDIDSAYLQLAPLMQQQKVEIKSLTQNILAQWFPSKVERVPQTYHQGQLGRLIRQYALNADDLSPEDTEEVLSLISTFPEDNTEIRRKQLSSAKEKIDQVYIETILQDFETLFSQKNDSKKLEERWHQFFKENSWIFSQLFAFPMVLFKDKAYVGGKTIFDSNGKIADFLYKNEFSENIAIVEIKTHKTKLMGNSTYRGTDVFPISKDLSGAINQALDQRDNLQKDYYQLNKGNNFNSFNSKCIVLIGKITELTEEQIKSYELFRSNNKDVEIVTFDELHFKIESLISIFKSR